MRLRVLCFLLAAASLPGCTNAGSAIDTAAGAGVAGGVASGVHSITGSTLIGIAAGIGAGVGLDVGIKYVARRIHRNVQDAVATAAGPLGIGQSTRWEVDRWLPWSGKRGTVETARSFGAAIPCKDVVFTVDDDEDNVYVTTLCRDKRGNWRWALAEPTVDRWDSLQ